MKFLQFSKTGLFPFLQISIGDENENCLLMRNPTHSSCQGSCHVVLSIAGHGHAFIATFEQLLTQINVINDQVWLNSYG